MAAGRAKAMRTVGRYQLVHELTHSYLGPLWAVRVEGPEGKSQLTMLRLVSLARLDADTRVRLLEAAWQAMEVRDDSVASVVDVVASDGELGVVSEFVEGVTLRGLGSFASVRRKPAPASVAVRIALDLLGAVATLHRTTAELGDEAVPLFGGLSADSVLVTVDGRTLVLDVAVSSAASTIETLGGNPERSAYAAPEQLAPTPIADARTDVFAVGVLLWELLGCRRLFVGSDRAVVQKVLSSKIPKPDELKRRGDPVLPPALVSVVMRALERDPAARPQTPEAFASLLAESGTAPAEHAEVAEYVTALAEGALQRARDALRVPSSGTRARVTAAPAAPQVPASPHPVPGARPPAATARAPEKPMPRSPPAAAEKTVPRTPQVASPRARPDVGPGPAPKRPALPARTEARPLFRARQPTMIGIPAPASHPAPEPPPTITPPADPIPSSVVESVREDSYSGEEPTAQFTSRDLMSQVEAMARQSEPARRAPTEAPRAAPEPASDFPEPNTVPRLEDAPRLDAPADGGWLDDPASLPPPPMAAAPAPASETPPTPVSEVFSISEPPVGRLFPDSVAPEPELEPAPRREPGPRPEPEPSPPPRAPERAAPARPSLGPAPFPSPAPTPSASLPPAAAYLPSQVPPPLFHDPRARSASRKRPVEPAARRSGPSRTTLIGAAVSLALLVVSTTVGIVVLRGSHEPTPEPAPTTQVATPPAPAAAGAVAAAPAAEATAAPLLPASAEAAPATEPSAEAPAPEQTAPSAEPPEPSPVPAPVRAVSRPVAPKVTAPAMSRTTAPKKKPAKKKGVFMPDDI